MSSIYKKGRDGYFYYQAYVYNNDSKKKDKKIFHALSTKDINIAKIKQSELDLKYENNNSQKTIPRRFLDTNPRTNILIMVVGFFLVIVYTSILIPGKKINRKKTGLDSEVHPINNIGKSNPNSLDALKTVNENQKSHMNSSILSVKKIDKINISEKVIKPVLPDYKVERVDSLPSAFNQGKIYVTLDVKVSDESQRLVCEQLKSRYTEFSNIMIFLYSSDLKGRNLAMGYNKEVSSQKKKESWLAMYTYNSVEGEYFNNEPSRYLNHKN